MDDYRAMILAELAGYLLRAGQYDDLRWRPIAELLEEYRHEPVHVRRGLLAPEPLSTGDEQWDVLLAALAEHLAARDGRRGLRGRSVAVLIGSAPHSTRGQPESTRSSTHHAAFRRRGVFVVLQELEVA